MTFIKHHDSREAGISAVVYRVSFVADNHSISVGHAGSNPKLLQGSAPLAHFPNKFVHAKSHFMPANDCLNIDET